MRKPRLAPIDPNKHTLRREHIDQIKNLLLLKAHHQQIINGLDQQIATILNIGYGADIMKEDWHLDLEKGLMSRVSSTDRPQSKPDNLL